MVSNHSFICCKCGKFMKRSANKYFKEHSKEYLCALCRPKIFCDYDMERILREFNESESDNKN